MTKYVLAATLVVLGAAGGGAVPSAQAPAPAPSGAQPATIPGAAPAAAPSTGCPELATAVTALMRNDARLRDWPNLARYREANRTLPRRPPAIARGVHGRLDHRRLAAAALRRVLPRQAVRRPRHQRPDDAADAAAVPAGRDRPEAEGGRDPRRHERHRRQHRSDDERGDPGQPRVDERARARATASRWCFSSITPVSAYHVATRTRAPQTIAAADGADQGDQRLDEDLRRRARHIYLDYFSAMIDETGHAEDGAERATICTRTRGLRDHGAAGGGGDRAGAQGQIRAKRGTITVTLPTRPLGRSGLDITRVGFGSWAVGGGGWAFGWGPQDDDGVAGDDAPRARARHQLDRHRGGVRARPFGGGRGAAAARAAAADRPFVFTKCGLVWDEHDRMATPRADAEAGVDPARVRSVAAAARRRADRSLPVSLARRDRHAGRGFVGGDGAARRGGKGPRGRRLELRRARCSIAAKPIRHVDSLQPPFSLDQRRRRARPRFPGAPSHGTGVICYSPMQSGLLTDSFTAERVAALAADDWRRRAPEFQPPNLGRNLALRDALRPIAAAPRHDGVGGGDRLDAGVAGGHRRDRRRPLARAGGRLDRRGRARAHRRGPRRDRGRDRAHERRPGPVQAGAVRRRQSQKSAR